MVDSVNLKNYL